MPVEIGVYFPRENVQKLIDILSELPQHLKPKYFSDKESIGSDKDKISNANRFDRFITRNPVGFFLIADECLYNFFLHEKGYSRLYCDVSGEGYATDVPLLFRATASATPVFGFADEHLEETPDEEGSYVASQDKVLSELGHRNRFVITIGENNIESSIGLDLDKYIPGLYWYTLLSNELLDKHDVVLDDLSIEAISTVSLDEGSLHLLQFFKNPGDWRTNVERLDDLCERIQGIFSKRLVESAVSNVSSYLEYDELIAKWR